MRPPETPIPPAASRHRREIPPSYLSPSFSRRPFAHTAASVPAAAAADGDNGGAVSEQPHFKLFNWWLASVEGDDQKFFIAGEFERNQKVMCLAPTPIAKRHKYNILENEDGVLLHICGPLNLSRTRGNGYTDTACEKFMIGFPYWWDSCNHLYLKETKSQTGCTPISLFEKDKQFYLEKYQLRESLHLHGATLRSKLFKSVKRMSPRKDIAFQSSHLSNGAPRFEEYSAASSGEGERHEALCNEVDNAERYLTVGRALRERDGGDIENNASLLLTVEHANDNGNEEAINAPPTSDQGTAVVSLKAKGCQEKKWQMTFSEKAVIDKEMLTSVCIDVQNPSDLSSEIPRFEKNTCLGDIPANEDAAALNDDSERCPTVPEEVNSMEISLIELSEKAAVDEEMPTSVCVDAENSSYLSNEIPRFEKNTCLGDIPTNEDAAALNDNSERCTAVSEEVNSMEIGLTVGSAINVSLDPTVECTNDAVNEGVDNSSLSGCKKPPVASLKSQGCQEKHLQTPSNEKHPSTPKKRRSELVKLQGPTRRPVSSPIPYAHDSPLTRGRVTSLSMSTPESLKLRRTRSGRVIVPTLDPGCQRIVYDMDGMITGVIGLDPPSPIGSNLKTYARKKSEPAEASKLKTYTRKKRRAEPAAASKMKTYARRKKKGAE